MLTLLRRRLDEFLIRRRLRIMRRKIRVLETMGLPEELKRAAINRVHREFEHSLDRFTGRG